MLEDTNGIFIVKWVIFIPICLVAGFSKSSPGFIDMDRKSSAILDCWKEAVIQKEHFTVDIPNIPLEESDFKPIKVQTHAKS